MRIVSGGSLGDDVALIPTLRALRRERPHEAINLTVRNPDVFASLAWLQGDDDDGTSWNLALGGNLREHLSRCYGHQLGVHVFDVAPRMELRGHELMAAHALLADHVGRGAQVLAVDTWAGWPSRRYALAHWQMVVDTVREAMPDVAVVEVGKSVPDCMGVTRGDGRLAGTRASFVDRLTVRETAALLAACNVYAGSDSGLAHVAAAVETPNVVLYGPKPWWTRAYPSTLPLFAYDSHPCTCDELTRDCGAPSCVDRIDPARVASAVLEALS